MRIESTFLIDSVQTESVSDSGNPQRTVLGPLLSLIPNLPLHVTSQGRLFVDDGLIYRPLILAYIKSYFERMLW